MKKSFSYNLTQFGAAENTVTEQIKTSDGIKTITTDANTGAVILADSVDPDSLNPVTAAAVADAVASASGEVPVIGDGDNGKVLKAVVDGSSKSVAWGDDSVDQTYDPTSTNAQSGTAVAGALATLPKFNMFKAKYAPGTVPTLHSNSSCISYWNDNSSEDNIWVFAFGTKLKSAFTLDTNLLEIIDADINCPVNDITSAFQGCTALTSVPLFDTSSVTSMTSAFQGCTALTSVPLFDTSSVTNMTSAFQDCTAVESGALALYTQASTQTTPPTSHKFTFTNCGSGTVTGAQELAEIPSSWGGTGA